MAVLVTGGAGFIGSNLVDELMTQGHEVTVVDNLSEGNLNNLKKWKNNNKFEFVKGDIRDLTLMNRLCDHKGWVFHLAGCSRIQPSITDPNLAWDNNIIGTSVVLQACKNAGVKRVVYSASSSAYGLLNEPPLNEDMKTDCLNPYSLSKKVGEEMMEIYNKLYGLSTISLRYFNVYGPRHQEEGAYATVIAIFRKQKRLGQKLTVTGDGEQRRDFTFVTDIVRANILAAMTQDVIGTYNVGTGINYSINEVAKLVEGEIVNIEARPAEARITLADINKIRKDLGWKPEISLEVGLEVLNAYEQKNSNNIILSRGF